MLTPNLFPKIRGDIFADGSFIKARVMMGLILLYL
jgi:hypothetical protein